jgi:hypothetical protein
VVRFQRKRKARIFLINSWFYTFRIHCAQAVWLYGTDSTECFGGLPH